MLLKTTGSRCVYRQELHGIELQFFEDMKTFGIHNFLQIESFTVYKNLHFVCIHLRGLGLASHQSTFNHLLLKRLSVVSKRQIEVSPLPLC